MYHMRHNVAPNALTVHLLHAHAVTFAHTHFTPTHFNLVQSAARNNNKKPRGAAGTTGITMVSLIPAGHCFRNDKREMQFLEVIVISSTLQKSSRKYTILTITERSRRCGRQRVLQGRLIYLYIYLLTYLFIFCT